MKLRYYLRGLGIGIIVTALTMGIASGGGRPLTDAEIRAAAYELGMVDSGSLKLTDIQPTPTPDATPEPTPEPTPTPTPDATPEPTPEPTPTPTPEESPEPISESTPAPEESSSEESGTVTVTIKSGSGSRTVCNQLKEAGLIEDAGAFDQYLMDNGYSRRICVGTYEIELGAGWEKIAKIISKTK